MDTITINWEKTNIDNLKYFEDAYFYSFTKGKHLVYIGIAYNLDVIVEIKQKIRIFELSNQGLIIWLGFIHGCSLKKIYKCFILDIESLLIAAHDTLLNTHSTDNVICRDNVKIINKNHTHLYPIIKYKDSIIYYKNLTPQFS